MVNGLMRSIGPRRRDPAELMKALNDELVRRKVEARYVTLLLMLWHPHSSSFSMSNAGGSPPMVCRNGNILRLHVEGVPLGLLEHRDYDEVRFQAQKDDLLVLFSDGVTDHLNCNGEEYGRERVAEMLRQNCSLSVHEIVDRIFADLDAFNTERYDDQTLIVMRVR